MQKPLNIKFWLSLSVLNLIVVALLGTLMRYKIGFEFPHFEQKFLQHGHSHFAFAAWISQTILVLMLRFIQEQSGGEMSAHYRKILIANTLSAWGMLIAFVIQGYGAFAIGFSQASILISYAFAFLYLRDLKKTNSSNPALSWFRAALLFNIISSLGTYMLAYMMVTHQIQQKIYLGSVYFYLHFQYNGWFFFACAGILIAQLHKLNPDFNPGKQIFRLLAWSCIPAYLLSVLWLDLPVWVFALVVLAALSQTLGWAGLLRAVSRMFKTIKTDIPVHGRLLFVLLAISASIKFTLQLASCVPSVSQLAFGFRPIVIAYLHLVLLAVFSLFLLLHTHVFLQRNSTLLNRSALLLFVAGVFLNEIILAVQGIASFSYTMIPFANEALFAVALWMLTSAILIGVSMRRIQFK